MGGSSENWKKAKQSTIAVLAGGIGEEREVSLESGKCVADALQQEGVEVQFVDVTPDSLEILDDRGIDIFFPVLHGKFGEDGELQKVLEDRGLVFTGSGSQSSRIAFDKMLSKERFVTAGIETPAAIEFTPETRIDSLASMGKRFVVKPIRQGSSVGVEIVDGAEMALRAAAETYETFGNCMIEEFISGREVTVGVAAGEVLPIVEVKPKSGFYDYHAKYEDDATQYLFDTVTDEACVQKLQQQALACFEVLDCCDLGRVDFILADDGTPWVLEINTLPGFTSHSLLPMAGKKAGYAMGQLCLRIVDSAFSRVAKV